MLEAIFLVGSVVFAIFFFVFLLFAHIHGDRLLKKMYDTHRDIWLHEGQPKGWRWVPLGHIAHPFQKWWPTFSCVWRDPLWIKSAPDMVMDFRMWQKLGRCAIFAFIPAVIFGAAAALLDHFSR